MSGYQCTMTAIGGSVSPPNPYVEALTTNVTINDTIDQIDLIDIHRIFHLKMTDYTFFSSAHGTFFRIDHILGHKSSLGKFK